jgi:ribonuclease VapC
MTLPVPPHLSLLFSPSQWPRYRLKSAARDLYYITIWRVGLESAKYYLDQFLELPIEIIAPSSEIIMSASEIQAEYALSYADCFAVATALKFSASILTGDPEFKKVEHVVTIEWL